MRVVTVTMVTVFTDDGWTKSILNPPTLPYHMTVECMIVEPSPFLSLPSSLPYDITIEPIPFLIADNGWT